MIVRKYPTLLQMMGEVGGTCEIIVIFSGFIYMFFYFVVKSAYPTEDINKVFKIKSKDKVKFK